MFAFLSAVTFVSYGAVHKNCTEEYKQGNRLSGQPGNVRQFDILQGNIREVSGKNIVRGIADFVF